MLSSAREQTASTFQPRNERRTTNWQERLLRYDLSRLGKSIIILLGLFPFLRIPLITSTSAEIIVDAFTLVGTIAAIVSISAYFIRYKHLPKPFLLIILFELSILPFSRTYGFDQAVMIKFYATALYQIGYCWFIYLLVKKGDNYWISAMSAMLNVLVIINFVTIVLYPSGMPYSLSGEPVETGSSTRIWLLGYANNHSTYFVYAFLFSMLNAYKKNGGQISTTTIFLYVISLISTIMVSSQTSLVALIVFGIYIVFCGSAKKLSLVSIKSYLIIYLIIWIIVVALGTAIVSFPNEMIWFVESFLNKDLSFTGRSSVWLSAIEWIKTYPLFGNGAESYSMLFAKVGVENGPHNEILNILYEGGLVHAIFFIGLVFSFARPLYGLRKCNVAKAISIAIFLMLILQLMRGCTDLYWLSMYVLSAQIGTLVKQLESDWPMTTMARRHFD
jgi:O-antigen ligase